MPVQRQTAWLGWIGVLILVGVGTGCGSARPVAVEGYEEGGPSFVLEAIPVLRDTQPGLELYLGLRPRTLVFTHVDTAYQAVYEVLVRLLDEKGRVRYEQAFDDTLRVPTFAATRAHALHLWHRFVPYRSGRYRLEVTVTDRHSRHYTTRRRRVYLPDPAGRGPLLSPVWLERRVANGRYEVHPGLHVAAGVDSLRAAVELFKLVPRHRVRVQLLLLQFPTDTSAARPPYDLMPAPGSLAYRGVRYDRPETLQVSTRQVEGLSGSVRIDFMLPPLVERGVYRVEVTAQVEGQKQPAVSRRELAVHGPTFPQVETLDQMAEALVYLTYPDEWEQLRAARTSAELRARFDAFWGRLVGDRRKAARLLRLYYERVEQANLQFSTFKEGWRTDRGMVYIMLGPPYVVEDRIDEQIWYYTYSEQDPRYTFVFERVRWPGSPFVNYVLRRQPYYYDMWHRALTYWRTGQVL
ncbi:GWxTD domain-containing protein [Rhodothermus marinus]|uniref:GWxTD domain-containing protein n=1 Tax=Rhodothermus marinus TaxID=29549 RepID=UPI0012BA404A|nr:GWxTD domain-containing protein [Rhodothermus marinus]BBM69790.1 hypothetical protein RmaAA213_16360 [Rhodothermus marinus]BBM72776.1 hypothetical protein RmaAA338_16410 [Rhodothermus marinus]